MSDTFRFRTAKAGGDMWVRPMMDGLVEIQCSEGFIQLGDADVERLVVELRAAVRFGHALSEVTS